MSLPVVPAPLRAMADDFVDANSESYGERGVLAARAHLEASQIYGLQNVACSARRFTDVVDFVLNQTGRHKKWWEGDLGPALLGDLDAISAACRDETGGRLAPHAAERETAGLEDPRIQRALKLYIARAWAKRITVRYRFERSRH